MSSCRALSLRSLKALLDEPIDGGRPPQSLVGVRFGAMPLARNGVSVTAQEQIEAAVGANAFSRPTFYSNPGGLRFELSEGGAAVEQFLTALRKASEICHDIFAPGRTFTACLSVYLYRSKYSYREALRNLTRAGVAVPRQRSMWLTVEDTGDDESSTVLYLAFDVASTLLDCLLWCALGTDLGIRPCPRLRAVYLLSLEKRVLVHPYDDRGMDVVGKNHNLLAELYARHGRYLIDYDRPIMEETFEA